MNGLLLVGPWPSARGIAIAAPVQSVTPVPACARRAVVPTEWEGRVKPILTASVLWLVASDDD